MAIISKIIGRFRQPDPEDATYEIKELKPTTDYAALRVISKKRTASNAFVDPLYMSEKLHSTIYVDPIIYMSPGQQFGSVVKFKDTIFKVPKEFQKLSDAALVLPSMSFNVSEAWGRTLITVKNGKKINVVENFPANDGWYMCDEKTGMPVNTGSSSNNQSARYLFRRYDDQYVGLVIRGGGGNYVSRIINANLDKSEYHVALLERTGPESNSNLVRR